MTTHTVIEDGANLIFLPFTAETVVTKLAQSGGWDLVGMQRDGAVMERGGYIIKIRRTSTVDTSTPDAKKLALRRFEILCMPLEVPPKEEWVDTISEDN